MTKQQIWNKHNYSTEYPSVPRWMRGDSNHGGADEFDRKHKRWQDPYDERGAKRVTPHRMWTDIERLYIRKHFIDHKDMTIKQLCQKLGGVTKNALYNQIQYIREQKRFNRVLLLE